MQYVQPYGITDPNAPYINGNPSIGLQGSIPPAAAFEHPMREIVAVIEKNKFVSSSADLQQMLKAIRSQRANYCEDTGPVNQLVVALDPALPSYTIGLPLKVKVLHTNTASVCTLDAGAGAARIKKMDGTDPAIGDLPAGGVIGVTFDGTAWQLTNFGGAGGGGGGTTTYIGIPYAVDTGTVNNIVAPFSPAITALAPGFVCLVKLANTVTGPATLKVNALSPIPVLASDGGPLLPADIIAGNIIFMKYDGSNFIADTDITVISNVTYPIPSTGFPTVDSVMVALKRKLISPLATVTIQLAIGVYPPIKVSHPNGDRIVVKGTMKAAAPTQADFQATAAGVNNADSTANIAMLRARYGTEVHVDTSYTGNVIPLGAVGLANIGAGQPLFQDILVTGDDNRNQNLSPVVIGVGAFGCQRLSAKDVAVWGCMQAFDIEWNAFMDLNQVYWTGNSGWGLYAHSGGSARLRGLCVGQGNYAGITSTLGGKVFGFSDGNYYIRFNGDYGVASNDHANAFFLNLTATNNATYGDLLAFNVSEIAMGTGCVWGTASPAVNVVGNQSSLISYTASNNMPNV
jgi:hypothetical protein